MTDGAATAGGPDPVLFAYALGGPRPGCRLAGDAEVAEALRHPDPAWLHLKADDPRSDAWIATHLGYLDPQIRAALTEPETRPRVARIEQGLLVILRGVNHAPGADPQDMVSLRIWLEPARIVSLSRREVQSVRALAERVAAGQGPDRVGRFLAALTDRLVSGIEAHLNEMDDEIEEIEDVVIDGPDPALRTMLADERRNIVTLRRHLAPQRDAMAELARCEIGWLGKADRRHLQETQHRMMRSVETLDGMRERLQLIREELSQSMSEGLNRNLYVLSLMSAVFLPLGFLTGLMGINLAGIPGAQWAPAFWVFVGLLAAVAVFVLIVLRRLRLF